MLLNRIASILDFDIITLTSINVSLFVLEYRIYQYISKIIQSTIYDIWAWTMIVAIPCLLSVLITYEFTNAIE